MNPSDLFDIFKKYNSEKRSLFIRLLISSVNNDEFNEMFELLSEKYKVNGEILGYNGLNQFDIIFMLESCGLYNIVDSILYRLNAIELVKCQNLSRFWRLLIINNKFWKRSILKMMKENQLWSGLSEIRGWIKYIQSEDDFINNEYFYKLYLKIIKDIKQLKENWRTGNYIVHKIACNSENIKGVYSLQYDNDKIVSGLRDNTIKIWDKKSLTCRSVLHGHSGSVLCLQFDAKVIITGSSDSTVKIWDIETGTLLNTLFHHTEAVLHLRFNNNTLVTCSKDRFTFVFDLNSPQSVQLRQTLVGHRAAVNVVDFDSLYIITASGDRTIKVWDTLKCNYIKTLSGHKRGIACLQYRYPLVISGSSDSHIRLWNVEDGNCLQVLEGHEELVRCIRFDQNRIISGAYDGRIKVWNLELKQDFSISEKSHCLITLQEHIGRVFRLQFDDFQIISSSHDDTILIWDFLPIVSPSYWDP